VLDIPLILAVIRVSTLILLLVKKSNTKSPLLLSNSPEQVFYSFAGTLSAQPNNGGKNACLKMKSKS